MKYVKQLDGLRFVAVSLVLIEHFAVPIGRKISAGFYGVDLFFVISGFLITQILLRSRGRFLPDFKNFIGRRTLRIFPLYYSTVLILFLLGNPDVTAYLKYILTYTYNYADVYYKVPLNSITHFWSLCVEEQFYLFWPMLVLSLRSRLTVLSIVILFLTLICTVQLCFQIFPSVSPYNFRGLFPQANSLGIGALGALLNFRNKIPLNLLKNKNVEWLAIIVLVFFLFCASPMKYIICPVISLFFILKAVHTGFALTAVNNFLLNKHIVYLGSIAYGIYLFHLPLGYYLTEKLFDPLIWQRIDFASLPLGEKIRWNSWIFKFPLYTLITILLAHISYSLFERPILRYKDRWFKY